MTEAATPPGRRPSAVVFGCAGPSLSEDERHLFADVDPLGLILFQRNCRSPDGVRGLVDEFRAVVGRDDASVLIDQEGGRVQRLQPPHWRQAPAAGALVAAVRAAGGGLEETVEVVHLNARLIAAELADLGITVDCAPVLDIPVAGADAVIGDRAFGVEPGQTSDLGRAACDGFLAGGVVPVIKHVPGHGRATVDSHRALPVVDAPLQHLLVNDFAPFRDLAEAPWAMTAHVVYTAVDADHPATLSEKLIGDLIRRDFGFDGVLVSDDIVMAALDGTMAERAAAAIAAGCDVVLHCNGVFGEMVDVAEAVPRLSDASDARLLRAEILRLRGRRLAPPFDADEGRARLDQLTGGAA